MAAPSWRTAPLPPDWPKLRLQVLERDGHQCTKIRSDTGRRCSAKERLEVDHCGDGPNDHRLESLRTLCYWHHRQRTSSQAGLAAAAAKKARPFQRTRTPERHPGLL